MTSKYSVTHNGKVLDFRFEKQTSANTYLFLIGDISVATLRKFRAGWYVLVIGEKPLMRNAEGFATRMAAAEFALKSAGYRHPNY
jgi:hypothetical protein